MLRLPRHAYLAIVAHALDEAPLECCGLLTGPGPSTPAGERGAASDRGRDRPGPGEQGAASDRGRDRPGPGEQGAASDRGRDRPGPGERGAPRRDSGDWQREPQGGDDAHPMSDAVSDVSAYVPCTNAARSSRVYTLEPRDLLRADRAAQEAGLEIVGVVHSHTHTPPYPSATDVAAAVDPGWHYVIVSLALGEPSVRAFRISGGAVTEERISVGG